MKRSVPAVVALSVLGAACSRSSAPPRPAAQSVSIVSQGAPTTTAGYLTALLEALRAVDADPRGAAATLRRLRERPLPSALTPEEGAFVRREIARTLAIADLAGGDSVRAVADIEPVLPDLAAAPTSDSAQVASVWLVATAAYRSAGRNEAAERCRAEARRLVEVAPAK